MKTLTLKSPDPTIDAAENEARRSGIFQSKWRSWQNFKLLATLVPIAFALVFGLIWAISY